ncbi:endolytic transglycosylase MltG [Sphaerisporangium sp. NPDC051017]|uniref:endolytic transglycosylase MltG n=1 Tax=Sphaerisporangium sp. NPDC051017 TaxID=3154636 RepID=UPI0034467743
MTRPPGPPGEPEHHDRPSTPSGGEREARERQGRVGPDSPDEPQGPGTPEDARPRDPHEGPDDPAAPVDRSSAADAGPGAGEEAAAESPGDTLPRAAEETADSEGLIRFSEDREPEREEERRRRGRRALLALVGGGSAVLVAAGLAGAFALFRPLISPGDFDGPGTDPVVVEIAPGASAGEIAETLVRAEVVASARAFVGAVERRGATNNLRPGRYRMRKRMASALALDTLLSPKARIRRRVTVPEGLRANETVARLAKGSGLPAAELATIVAAPARLGLPPYANGAAEGFLFPATYEIEPTTRPQDLLRASVRRFKRAATRVDLEAGAARQRLTPRDVVVIASIVQAEGGHEADYPKIARVIYNRLASRAKLEMDSTVMYGLGKHGIVASHAEIKRDTPYNTYMHPGLPPGPICNPGEAALRAALSPAQGDWYWFVTVDPARRITRFTSKESEFVKFREELHKRLGQH